MSDESGNGSGDRQGARGLRVYRRDDARPLHETGMMSMPVMEPEATEQMIEWATSGGQVVKVLFGDPEGSGMSLVWSWFAPGFPLPRHTHAGDCLYFVHRGELRMGNTVIGEREGFFLPNGAPYAYTAGPEGVEVLEFRNVCEFDMHIMESLGRWDQMRDIARENSERWTAEAESHA